MEALKSAIAETHWLNNIEVVTSQDMRDFLDQRPMNKCETEVVEELKRKANSHEFVRTLVKGKGTINN